MISCHAASILPGPEKVQARLGSLQHSTRHLSTLDFRLISSLTDPSPQVEKNRRQVVTRNTSNPQSGGRNRYGPRYQQQTLSYLFSRASLKSDYRDIESQLSNIAPALPENEFDYNIIAKSSFQHKHTPASSYTFLLVNVLVFAALITGAVLYKTE